MVLVLVTYNNPEPKSNYATVFFKQHLMNSVLPTKILKTEKMNNLKINRVNYGFILNKILQL